MRQWNAIHLEQDYTADAAVYSANIDYTVDGEMRRRNGQELVHTQGANTTAYLSHPSTGMWYLYATSTGTIEALAP